MNARIRCAGVLLTLGVAWSAAPAALPPVSFLMPNQFSAGVGVDVQLRVEAGTPPTAQTGAWPGEKLASFFVLADGTRENRDSIAPAAGEKNDTVAVRIAQPGVTMIGFNTKPSIVALSAADLKTFLTKNGAGSESDAAVRELAGDGVLRVRRIESATTIVRAPSGKDKPVPSGVAMTKRGQAAEIQPLVDPTMLQVGHDLPVRVFIHSAKQTGVKLQATTARGPQTAGKLTDATGSTYFRVSSAGVWRLEFHYAQRLENDQDADWVLYSGTLTFEVAAEGAGK